MKKEKKNPHVGDTRSKYALVRGQVHSLVKGRTVLFRSKLATHGISFLVG